MIISRALYGLKNSGAEWRIKLEENLKSLGYKPSDSEANVWMKCEFNPNVNPYYKYMLCYIEDLLHIGSRTK